MSHDTVVTSDEEVYEDFKKLLAICQMLKEKGRLYSAYRISVKNGKIDSKPIQPTGKKINLYETVSGLLFGHQVIREKLSQSFDLSSSKWNNSPIGKMLDCIERQLREQTNALQLSVKEGKPETHNPRTIIFMSSSIMELYPLLTSPAFWKRTSERKLVLLNKKAEKFFAAWANYSMLQQIGWLGETVIAMDVLIAEQGLKKSSKFMRALVKETGIFERYLNSLQ